MQISYLHLALLLSMALHWAVFLLVGTAVGDGIVESRHFDVQQRASIRIQLLARVSTESEQGVFSPIGQTVTDVARAVPVKSGEVVPGLLFPEPAESFVPPLAAGLDAVTRPVAVDLDQPAMLEITSPSSHYFNVWELSTQPLVLTDTSADQVLELTEETTQPLIAHLLINENGTIDQIVLEPTSLSEEAQQFVIAAFSKTRFSPGKLGYQPVKTDLMIEIRLDVVNNK